MIVKNVSSAEIKSFAFYNSFAGESRLYVGGSTLAPFADGEIFYIS